MLRQGYGTKVALLASAIQSFGMQMGSPPGNQYRVRARECMEAADRINEAGRRIILLELAQRWLTLADQIDGIEARRQPMGDALLDTPEADQSTH